MTDVLLTSTPKRSRIVQSRMIEKFRAEIAINLFIRFVTFCFFDGSGLSQTSSLCIHQRQSMLLTVETHMYYLSIFDAATEVPYRFRT